MKSYLNIEMIYNDRNLIYNGGQRWCNFCKKNLKNVLHICKTKKSFQTQGESSKVSIVSHLKYVTYFLFFNWQLLLIVNPSTMYVNQATINQSVPKTIVTQNVNFIWSKRGEINGLKIIMKKITDVNQLLVFNDTFRKFCYISDASSYLWAILLSIYNDDPYL